jgi:hypothetical protein
LQSPLASAFRRWSTLSRRSWNGVRSIESMGRVKQPVRPGHWSRSTLSLHPLSTLPGTLKAFQRRWSASCSRARTAKVNAACPLFSLIDHLRRHQTSAILHCMFPYRCLPILIFDSVLSFHPASYTLQRRDTRLLLLYFLDVGLSRVHGVYCTSGGRNQSEDNFRRYTINEVLISTTDGVLPAVQSPPASLTGQNKSSPVMASAR